MGAYTVLPGSHVRVYHETTRRWRASTTASRARTTTGCARSCRHRSSTGAAKKLGKRERVKPRALLSGLRPQGRRPRGAHHHGDRTAVTFRV